MIKIPAIKKSEWFLIVLLIIEFAYICPFATRLKGPNSYDPLALLRPHSAANPVQRYSGSNHAMPTTQILAKCIISASSIYQVPPDVLIGIMSVEGGHIGEEVGPNFNGTYDLGPMQINTLWVPQLAQIWRVDNRTAREWLRDDGCENVYVAAWILKQKIVDTGTLYNGIAFYHSATRGRGGAYANKVVSTMKRKGFFHHVQKK